MRKIKVFLRARLVWWRAKFWFYRYFYFRSDVRSLKKFLKSNRGEPRACFVFSSKNRLEFTKQSLASIEQSNGFDILWLDASSDSASLEFFRSYQPENFRIVGRLGNISGGPDAAILLGLNLLAESHYDYVGLIENDVFFKDNWFPPLLDLFKVKAEGAKEVGGVSLRNYKARNLKVYENYSLAWNLGAGMILFTKRALFFALKGYGFMSSFRLRDFYNRKFGLRLESKPDPLYIDAFVSNKPMSGDSKFCYNLWNNDFACVASIPSMAFDLDFDKPELYL